MYNFEREREREKNKYVKKNLPYDLQELYISYA